MDRAPTVKGRCDRGQRQRVDGHPAQAMGGPLLPDPLRTARHLGEPPPCNREPPSNDQRETTGSGMPARPPPKKQCPRGTKAQWARDTDLATHTNCSTHSGYCTLFWLKTMTLDVDSHHSFFRLIKVNIGWNRELWASPGAKISQLFISVHVAKIAYNTPGTSIRKVMTSTQMNKFRSPLHLKNRVHTHLSSFLHSLLPLFFPSSTDGTKFRWCSAAEHWGHF